MGRGRARREVVPWNRSTGGLTGRVSDSGRGRRGSSGGAGRVGALAEPLLARLQKREEEA